MSFNTISILWSLFRVIYLGTTNIKNKDNRIISRNLLLVEVYNLILKYETKMIYGLDKECNFVTIPIIGKESSEIRFIIQI